MKPEFKRCNIFALKVEALVNPVNCVGAMGRGLALEFKRRFPVMFDEYKKLCKDGGLKLGEVKIVPSGVDSPKDIILFPTKAHWRENSLLLPIISGLQDMLEKCKEAGIKSVGVPALGCGLGGLQWSVVEQILRRELLGDGKHDIRFIVVEPITKTEV